MSNKTNSWCKNVTIVETYEVFRFFGKTFGQNDWSLKLFGYWGSNKWWFYIVFISRNMSCKLFIVHMLFDFTISTRTFSRLSNFRSTSLWKIFRRQKMGKDQLQACPTSWKIFGTLKSVPVPMRDDAQVYHKLSRLEPKVF